MIGLKEYKAYVLSIQAIDTLMETAFDVKGIVRRNSEELSYTIRFADEEDKEQFQTRMAEYKITHWAYTSDISKDTAMKILARQMGVPSICSTFVNNGNQIILVEKGKE